MHYELCTEVMWQFIAEHINDDPDKLRLRFAGRSDLGFDVTSAITQIDCRRRAKHKLPTFTAPDSRFIFPHTLSAEQCTSEALAKTHASLVSDGATLLDMTCGLGIDAMAMAGKCSQVTAIERNPDTVAAVRKNLQVLGINNMQVIEADSEQWLQTCTDKFDVIFIDPARRSEHNKRLFSLADCSPDVTVLLPRMLEVAPKIIVKASPMLDITEMTRSVPGIDTIQVLCLVGECKEVLLVINRNPVKETTVEVYADNTLSLRYSLNGAAADIRYADNVTPDMWLYEPNAGVMKTGAWGVLCNKYPDLYKLHPNTQLFVSDQEIPDFPGRRLRIAKILSGKDAKKELKGSKHNIVSRNHPLSPDQLAKKYNIKPGGTDFLYALTTSAGPTLLLCTSIIDTKTNN